MSETQGTPSVEQQQGQKKEKIADLQKVIEQADELKRQAQEQIAAIRKSGDGAAEKPKSKDQQKSWLSKCGEGLKKIRDVAKKIVQSPLFKNTLKVVAIVGLVAVVASGTGLIPGAAAMAGHGGLLAGGVSASAGHSFMGGLAAVANGGINAIMPVGLAGATAIKTAAAIGAWELTKSMVPKKKDEKANTVQENKAVVNEEQEEVEEDQVEEEIVNDASITPEQAAKEAAEQQQKTDTVISVLTKLQSGGSVKTEHQGHILEIKYNSEEDKYIVSTINTNNNNKVSEARAKYEELGNFLVSPNNNFSIEKLKDMEQQLAAQPQPQTEGNGGGSETVLEKNIGQILNGLDKDGSSVTFFSENTQYIATKNGEDNFSLKVGEEESSNLTSEELKNKLSQLNIEGTIVPKSEPAAASTPPAPEPTTPPVEPPTPEPAETPVATPTDPASEEKKPHELEPQTIKITDENEEEENQQDTTEEQTTSESQEKEPTKISSLAELQKLIDKPADKISEERQAQLSEIVGDNRTKETLLKISKKSEEPIETLQKIDVLNNVKLDKNTIDLLNSFKQESGSFILFSRYADLHISSKENLKTGHVLYDLLAKKAETMKMVANLANNWENKDSENQRAEAVLQTFGGYEKTPFIQATLAQVQSLLENGVWKDETGVSLKGQLDAAIGGDKFNANYLTTMLKKDGFAKNAELRLQVGKLIQTVIGETDYNIDV